jgi:DNA-binding CsgD family transcriptional regulator
MVAQGQTNAEIAAALHLSIDTVKSHLKHIYGKSGVRDRGRLVVAARRSGFGRGTL